MSSKKRSRKEEDLQKKKKALKRAFQKEYSGKKRVGSKRLSDTQKYLIVGVTAIVIIFVVAVQFMKPPIPYCYFTEGDFVYATLDQDAQNITFSYINAFYYLSPKNTYLSCDIVDYFDPAFNFDFITEPASIDATELSDHLLYRISNRTAAFSYYTRMENGTPLQMSTWVNLTEMVVTPSTIPKGITTIVNFKIDIVTCTAIDRCNISLQFNRDLENTTITFSSITNGTADESSLYFYTKQESLSANTHVVLDFNLSINTNLSLSAVNLLNIGEIHLVIDNKLLSAFAPYSKFKESTLTFAGFMYDTEPTVVKARFLDIVVEIPSYTISISS